VSNEEEFGEVQVAVNEATVANSGFELAHDFTLEL
jgi:hypothetical protein